LVQDFFINLKSCGTVYKEKAHNENEKIFQKKQVFLRKIHRHPAPEDRIRQQEPLSLCCR